DADGARSVAIADHADAGIELAPLVRGERPLHAVEGSHFFARLCAAHHDFVIANLIVIEGVQGVAEFEHHVIRNVHDIADAGDAGSFEAVFHPFWGRLNFHISNHPRGETAAEFRGLNFDLN